MAEAFQALRRLPRRSIFFKLFLIFLSTAIAVIVVIRGFVFLGIERNHSFQADVYRNLAKYSAHLAEEIGSPPSRERAKALATTLGLQFSVKSPRESWATDHTLPPIDTLHMDRVLGDHQAQAGSFRRHPFVLLERNGTQYAVFFLHRPFLELPAWAMALLLGVIVLIIGGSYLAVRRLLYPVRLLKEGAKAIGQGRFDYHVPMTSPDELGDLSASFNEMATHVRHMIRSRDRLLLDISHELRSPVTRMKLAAELIEDPSVKEHIQADIHELEAMVTELLESARLDTQHGGLVRTETDLVALVRDVGDKYRDHQPTLCIVAEAPQLLVPLDQERVRTALCNVIENAQKHSPPDRGPIDIHITRSTHAVDVSVRDQGPGVPTDEQALIFEPFYRVDASRTRRTGGYGLGLSLARRIMRAHDGDLTLTSKEQRGSTFTLTFPLQDGEAHDA